MKLQGFASIVLDDCLVINGIKIIVGRSRKFIQMPNVKKKTGKYRDLAFPTVPDIRAQIEKTIFEEYERTLEEEGRSPSGEEGEDSSDDEGRSPSDEEGESPSDEEGESPSDEEGESPSV
jgi:stage V sporulation protein G